MDARTLIRETAGMEGVESIALHVEDWADVVQQAREFSSRSRLTTPAPDIPCIGLVHGIPIFTDNSVTRGTYIVRGGA